MSRLRKRGVAGWAAGTAALAALCTTFIGGHEGLRTKAYRDVVGVSTICYGETKGVKLTDRYTKEQCDEMLLKRLDEFGDKLEACIKRPMTQGQYAAFLSLSYNIGSAGFCKSTAAREFNAGDTKAACNALLRFNRAGGRVLAGLTRRRQAERELCLKGA